jgi:hypothetical protein
MRLENELRNCDRHAKRNSINKSAAGKRHMAKFGNTVRSKEGHGGIGFSLWRFGIAFGTIHETTESNDA